MYSYRLQTRLLHHLLRLSPFAFIVHLPLSYQRQRYMCQLHQVSACPHTSVSRNERTNPPVYEFHQQLSHLSVNSRAALQYRTQSRHHRRPHAHILQRLSRSSRVAPDNVILQLLQPLVFHPPLSHRAKSRIDAVYHLLFGESFQKFVTILHTLQNLLVNTYLLSLKEDLIDYFEREIGNLYHINTLIKISNNMASNALKQNHFLRKIQRYEKKLKKHRNCYEFTDEILQPS